MRSIPVIVLYLLSFVSGLVGAFSLYQTGQVSQWLLDPDWRLPFYCILIGGLGGATYCLRGVYLNACVRKQWDPDWAVWYYLRPFVSLITGGVSWLFLKTGLLLLESSTTQGSSDLGFLVLAFVAGLNVDKFIGKVEELAQTVWGIEKSRTAKESESTNKR